MLHLSECAVAQLHVPVTLFSSGLLFINHNELCDNAVIIITRSDVGLTEVLVLGTGARTERLDPNVLNFLKKKGIAVEVQDTVNAVSTLVSNTTTAHSRLTV